MNYFEIITADRIWVCPKTGVYKIIAVGGGSACTLVTTARNISVSDTASGENTTFGNLLTAKGGVGYSTMTAWSCSSYGECYGGDGGYTLNQYGGSGALVTCDATVAVPCSLNGGTIGRSGLGYGASGGAAMYSTSISWYYTPSTGNRQNDSVVPRAEKSNAGEINELICDIEEGTNIDCHIGIGYSWTVDNIKAHFVKFIAELAKVNTAGPYDSVDSIYNRYIEPLRLKLSPGKSGCIVVEYLGESL